MKEIGGYFKLELADRGRFLHDDGILLNSCRNALKLVLLSLRPKRILLPKYTCDSVLQPIYDLKLDYKYYSINEKLEIRNIDLTEGDILLYTNYFGIKDAYVRFLSEKLGKQLIIDNAQSYYSEHIPGISTIYSPRKFFGVPDGGIVYVDDPIDLNFKKDKSFDRCRHLLRRYDESASEGYTDFRMNDDYLDNGEIFIMSELTKALLRNIDYDKIKNIRNQNFSYIQDRLSDKNKLYIDMNEIVCPMAYPFFSEISCLRKMLIDNKIYVATYWPNVIKKYKIYDFEYDLAKNLLPLPIDQRYDIKDMKYILKVIIKYGKL